MKTVFQPTAGMTPVDTSYCSGCSHGIAHRIIMECLEERGQLGKAIGVVPIGCSINAHHFMNVDMCESTHGRAPAIASGIRRVHMNAEDFPILDMTEEMDLAPTLSWVKTTVTVK